MNNNMGEVDRIIRVVIAVVIVALSFMEIISGVTASVLLVVAAVFALTSIVKFCPLYAIFGVSSCPKRQ